MLRFVRPALLCALLSLGLVRLSVADDPNVQTLFDGRTLDGWDFDPRYWRIEQGAIVGEIPPGTSLDHNTWCVRKELELRDFDLRLQFRVTGEPAANSGIQFRCQVDSIDHVSGYQADLDLGATWLGRIYDEHGRALLVERGREVHLLEDGSRRERTFAPAGQFGVLIRDGRWNEYRITAISGQVRVEINGTRFAELLDEQTGEVDLAGALALQLHSGPATKIEFRNLTVEHLSSDDGRLTPLVIEPADDAAATAAEPVGVAAVDADGYDLNLGFEAGDLTDWRATGDAFDGQPVAQDGIGSRWPDQQSGKVGDWFIGGYEKVGDQGIGTLVSAPFRVTHPYASFLIGGGKGPATRVELVRPATDSDPEEIVFVASGDEREQMRRVVADLRESFGAWIEIRVIDESRGGWGHLNFDDFRFHETPPATIPGPSAWRSTANPLLAHLIPNPVDPADESSAAETLRSMAVPRDFAVDLIAAEPELHQPMAFTFDARGRIWVVEGNSYPTKRPDGEGLDRILILEDADGDGTFETRKVFAEGLNLVSGLQVGFGGVWVGAAPELLFLPDADRNDVPDGPPMVMLDGFGYADTHETINSLMWGPDGWLYGNQGVFNRSEVGRPGTPAEERVALAAGVWRFHPTRGIFQVFAHGGSNQWGLDYDDHGELFMTHCRSYWGEGLTTHVMRGGHYWNQVNAGYAPFICPTPVAGLPTMRNYLLASARYGHGEGGAGKAGSGAVFGGHSHVGTMIYLGDNWPDRYRDHLFTHNLHGHQLNHQINRREAGGFDTIHAGEDLLFVGDPQYVGVQVQYGPDGAVYLSDWYDPRHCHSPNAEQWDRSNGRIYRMRYVPTWKPTAVDWEAAGDAELIEAQQHRNEWHGRTARRVLAERAARGTLDATTLDRLRALALDDPQPTRRLRGIWTLIGCRAIDAELLARAIVDSDEQVRGWAVRAAVEAYEQGVDRDRIAPLLIGTAERDDSLLVRRALAGAAQFVDPPTSWALLERLVGQAENEQDRDLPSMIWFALAQRAADDLPRAFRTVDAGRLKRLTDDLTWYAPRLSAEGRELVAARLVSGSPEERRRTIQLFAAGLAGSRGLELPPSWERSAERLYRADDPTVRRAAESIGAVFGDPVLMRRMREIVGDGSASTDEVRHALGILAYDSSDELVETLLPRLDDPALVDDILPLLGAFGDERIGVALVERLGAWEGARSDRALGLLAGRVAWGTALLDAIESGAIDKSRLTAFHARQLAGLGDASLDERLERVWGRLGRSSDERQREMESLANAYREAPLWAYDQGAGAATFRKLCANCHSAGPGEESIGPRLEGTGAKGIDYIVENLLDPNAVIGRDFQATVIATIDGRVVSGLVIDETESAITLRLPTSTETIAKDEIEERAVSENSFMPEGLIEPLSDRERIELLKFLMAL